MAVNETIERIVYEGVDKITAVSQKAADSQRALRQSIDGVKDGLAAVGVTVGAGALVALHQQVLAATAALDDMSESTGASVENLSAIQRVAKVGGHDFDGLTGQISRMVKGLREGGEEGSKTAQAFAFLNIKSRETDGKFRDTGEILVELAKKLETVSSRADRNLLVQDALGKGAERYIPLLKEIAEGQDLVATTTTKQAQQAEEAEKNIRRLTLSFTDQRRELVNEYTPALIKATEHLQAMAKAPGGFFGNLLSVSGSQAQDPQRALAEVEKRLSSLREQRDVLGGDSLGAKFNRMMAPEDLTVLYRQIAFAERQRGVLQELVSRQNRSAAGDSSSPLFDFSGGGIPEDRAYTGGAGGGTITPQQIAKQQEEALEEEKKVMAEAAALSSAFRANEAEQLKKFRALDLQDTDDYYAAGGAMLVAQSEDRMKLLIEQADREEALAIELGQRRIDADGLAHSLKLERFREEMLSGEQLEIEAHQRKLEQLAQYSAEELEALGGQQALKEQIEGEHALRLYQIRKRMIDSTGTLNRAGWQAQTGMALGALQEMTAGAAQYSKQFFEINKVATIALMALKAPSAIASSYEFGAAIGGPPLGAAMAGIAAAAMAVQVAGVMKAQYGGTGGVAPSVIGTTPAPPVTPVPSGGPPQGGIEGREVTLVIRGEGAIGRLLAEDLAAQLFDLKKDGGFPGLFGKLL